ncbi:hypothetical protein EDD18DRAFT_1107715 [Armillaria luteobubalina]|uniref:Uncharacterized protein n=1 Tax=Armillaria luteobubalina TaxID=153913 RepID=A0AA39Q2Q7_9AGAR|nr:hypothetical protein EDD18DRAFT_1107715 [Armillaria luteobubalina]
MGSGRADAGCELLCTDEKDQQAVILERIHAKDSCASHLVPESTPIASPFSYRDHGSENSSQEVEAAGNIEAPVFTFGGHPPSSAGIPMPLLRDVQALFIRVLFKGGVYISTSIVSVATYLMGEVNLPFPSFVATTIILVLFRPWFHLVPSHGCIAAIPERLFEKHPYYLCASPGSLRSIDTAANKERIRI